MANRKITVSVAVTAAVLCFAAGAYSVSRISGWLKSGLEAATGDAKAQESNLRVVQPTYATSVTLNDKQMASVKVDSVGEHDFPLQKTSVGSIDFNEELEVQVFTPYQGKILQTFAMVGDEVRKGQTLFTIDSPDLLNAEANLIAAAGVLELLDRNLVRLRRLYETFRSMIWTRGFPTSRPPKARCARRVMRCASSARPTPRST
jgi:cobalt-zinc-cadmium efflux system membrane fusion protein